MTESEAVSRQNATKEYAFYYPNAMWVSGDWAKNLILFFDGIALLVPEYMKDRPEREDPAIVRGLKEHGLFHIIEPEKSVDSAATEKLASALTDIIVSGALDELSKTDTRFRELSMSRMGYSGDQGLAQMIFEELRQRNLARESEDGVSIPVHPSVRSLILILLSQILRPYGATINAELSPATDSPALVTALAEMLALKAIPSTESVIQFDLNTVSVDLGPVPIDEVLDFRKQNFAAHRHYCLAARRFAQELSHMEEPDRIKAFDLRQAELDAISKDLRMRATKLWKKPGAFALSLTGAAITLAAGHPLAAALTLGATALNYSPAQKPAMGAYSYLFRAHERYGY
jgi:hypothetical protein